MIDRRNGYRTFFHYMGANRHLELSEFNQLNSQARIAHIAYLLLLPELERQDDQFGATGAPQVLPGLANGSPSRLIVSMTAM
jgi:hypothetical protein